MNKIKHTENEAKIFELLGKFYENESVEWLNITLDTMLEDWVEYTTDGLDKEAIQDFTYYTYTLKRFIEKLSGAWSRYKYEQDQSKADLCNPGRIDLTPGLN